MKMYFGLQLPSPKRNLVSTERPVLADLLFAFRELRTLLMRGDLGEMRAWIRFDRATRLLFVEVRGAMNDLLKFAHDHQ